MKSGNIKIDLNKRMNFERSTANISVGIFSDHIVEQYQVTSSQILQTSQPNLTTSLLLPDTEKVYKNRPQNFYSSITEYEILGHVYAT